MVSEKTIMSPFLASIKQKILKFIEDEYEAKEYIFHIRKDTIKKNENERSLKMWLDDYISNVSWSYTIDEEIYLCFNLMVNYVYLLC